jgi:hypothetical protein
LSASWPSTIWKTGGLVQLGGLREIIPLRQHSAKTDLLFIVEGLPQ